MSTFSQTHSLSPEEWLLSELGRRPPKWSLLDLLDDAGLGDWRAGLTGGLRHALALDDVAPVPPEVRVLDRYHEPGVTVERFLYNSEGGVTVPAYLLLPHVAELPQPAVIVCPDRGEGKASALGSPRAGAGDPGQPLVRRLLEEGFIVLVPDPVCSGERPARELPQMAVGAWLGRPLLGRWVHDVLAAVGVLGDRQEVQASRLAIVGFGAGGAVALYAMALDDRFRLGVVTGQLADYADRVRALAARHWHGLACELPGMAPGVLRLAELADVAALCSPRPLMMLHSPADFACEIEPARLCAQRIAEGYARLGGSGLFQPVFLPEMGSRADEAAREFLVRHLRAQYV